MKKLLNTVYVTTEGAAPKKDGENLVAEIEGVERARVPLHMLASVVAFGPILVTPALIGACAGAGITIVLLDRVGRFQARILKARSAAMCCCAAPNTARARRRRRSPAPSSSARWQTSAPC